MFLKRCERRKGGKKHTYWVLVESYRTPRGSRHRVVAYLGGLTRGETSGWAQLGRTLSGKRRTRPQPSLFDPPHYDEPDDDEPVLVKLKDIHLERLRGFGDVWLAWGLWRLVELDVLLDRIMPRGREEIPWPQMAAILTIARLCEPRERVAHRGHLVSWHGPGRSPWHPRREGPHRPTLRGTGSSPASQGRVGAPPAAAAGRPLRPEV